ncbi:four helix bundle protein [Flagellimonas flava]|uniref:four helix bundle protein n=1 Tax=Flagellimonas flava TaxID=570519 RepID=UPI003D64FC7E
MIEERSFKFALSIIKLVKELRNAKEFVFADQILRSATSIGANVAEAGAGQSKKDFIHKMAIASKEARETRYWLKLLNESKLVLVDFSDYLEEIDQIIKILTKIVKTSQRQFKT